MAMVIRKFLGVRRPSRRHHDMRSPALVARLVRLWPMSRLGPMADGGGIYARFYDGRFAL